MSHLGSTRTLAMILVGLMLAALPACADSRKKLAPAPSARTAAATSDPASPLRPTTAAPTSPTPSETASSESDRGGAASEQPSSSTSTAVSGYSEEFCAAYKKMLAGVDSGGNVKGEDFEELAKIPSPNQSAYQDYIASIRQLDDSNDEVIVDRLMKAYRDDRKACDL